MRSLLWFLGGIFATLLVAFVFGGCGGDKSNPTVTDDAVHGEIGYTIGCSGGGTAAVEITSADVLAPGDSALAQALKVLDSRCQRQAAQDTFMVGKYTVRIGCPSVTNADVCTARDRLAQWLDQNNDTPVTPGEGG